MLSCLICIFTPVLMGRARLKKWGRNVKLAPPSVSLIYLGSLRQTALTCLSSCNKDKAVLNFMDILLQNVLSQMALVISLNALMNKLSSEEEFFCWGSILIWQMANEWNLVNESRTDGRTASSSGQHSRRAASSEEPVLSGLSQRCRIMKISVSIRAVNLIWPVTLHYVFIPV